MEATSTRNFGEVTNFIWSIAELLRGDLKQSEYGRVVLPLTVLRRLDQVMEPHREAAWKLHAELSGSLEAEQVEELVKAQAGLPFYNASKLTFTKLLDDPNGIASNLRAYIGGFSSDAQRIFGAEGFELDRWIERLDKANLLYKVVGKFADVDLSPERLDSHAMGYVFEELIRRWAEQSNETAGEHFTPREVIRLMVNLLFIEDEDMLSRKGAVATLYDCACGTGGMLHEAERHLRDLNPDAKLLLYGQELNGESWAICVADMLIKGHDPSHIHYGNSFDNDGTQGQTFDYCITNPPFGVDWKKVADYINREHEQLGNDGRFGAGLPRTSDGQLLFLQHLVSKMKAPEDGGSRIAIVFNGSPLFTGAAGSGESNIRRWLIENDLLEAVVALPDQLFYNTGINTYFWIISNHKNAERKGKVQLLDGRSYFQKMRKSLGAKRHELSDEHINTLTNLYGAFEEGEHCQIKNASEFGYKRITVERPLRLRYVLPPADLDLLAEAKPLQKLSEDDRARLLDAFRHAPALDTTNADEFEKTFKSIVKTSTVAATAAMLKPIREACCIRDIDAPIVTNKKDQPEPDSELRDNENVPLTEDVAEYMSREVLPHVPDAWVKDEDPKIGYEIPFTRFFYKYEPPRPVEEIDAEIRELEGRIQELLSEVLV